MAKTGYVLAEFEKEGGLLAAAARLRELGHRRLDIHSPVPLHGADEALGLRKSPVPLIALIAGVSGAVGGYLMQWWMNAVDFPINVGNRGLHSPPTNIPITFECGVLAASLAIVFGLFALCGFPRTHHPVFEVEGFRTASMGALWLSAEVNQGDEEAVAGELEKLGARQVSRVGANP
ncbi:MAG TPA: DUF3341 domain-containing protein [Anaeromyxobacteraceae bacterium]|nr:DUF3341 domain-containing protein [Anaeromyxobacteraceae bacterium]